MINRKEYKAIKKYDRKQLEEYLTGVWRNGFNAGVESGDNADFRIKLSQVLNNTKGIGPKRYDNIMKTAKEMEDKND